MRRQLSVLIFAPACALALAAATAAGSSSLLVRENCSYKLLADRGIALTTKITLSNARGARATTVRVTPGWSIGRAYPKAETSWSVRVGPGYTTSRVVTRTYERVPKLWEALRSNGVRCASTYTYEIGR